MRLHPFLPFRHISDEQLSQGFNPTEPKASVTLPPEVLDKILEHIPTHRYGRPTLIACALVATWWTGPSQRRLFSSAYVQTENHQQWVDGVALSGSKAHLLQYVRSFQHFRRLGKGIKYPIQDFPKEPGEYFSALRNIHSLELGDIKIERFNKELETCFSAFRETLTTLTLKLFTTSFSAFVSLIDYFPNITTLQLGILGLEPDEGPVPSLSRPLRGKIRILPPHRSSSYLMFIDRLAGLDQEYEELVINPTSVPLRIEFLERILQFSTSTVKYLRLLGKLQREYSFHTSSPLRDLMQPPKS